MTTPTEKALLEFPQPLRNDDPGYALLRPEVERALAAAWEARCRLAVEALRSVSDEARSGYYDGPGLARFTEIRGRAEDAIAAIGELPPEGRE